jgi:hypothetical protein
VEGAGGDEDDGEEEAGNRHSEIHGRFGPIRGFFASLRMTTVLPRVISLTRSFVF